MLSLPSQVTKKRTVYPHKWLPISCRSGAGQGEFGRSETDVLPLSYTTINKATYAGRHLVKRSPSHVKPQCPFAVPSMLKC